MGDERTERPRVSIRRVVGAAIVTLGVLWIVSPFLIIAGPGMHKWAGPVDILISPFPYVGLLVIGFGLVLIRESSLDRILEYLAILLLLILGICLWYSF